MGFLMICAWCWWWARDAHTWPTGRSAFPLASSYIRDGTSVVGLGRQTATLKNRPVSLLYASFYCRCYFGLAYCRHPSRLESTSGTMFSPRIHRVRPGQSCGLVMKKVEYLFQLGRQQHGQRHYQSTLERYRYNRILLINPCLPFYIR